MQYKKIILEKSSKIAIITLNNPDSYNSYDPELAEELYKAFQDIKWDKNLRVAIIKANGKAFSAGGDIKSFKKALDKNIFPQMVEDLTLTLNGTIQLIKTMDKIVLSYIDGIVAGVGLSFALNVDISFATEDSVFIGGYNALATTPDGGSSYIFLKNAGLPKTLYFFLSNEKFPAKELESWGVISKVISKNDGFKFVMEFAKKIIEGPHKASILTKKLFNAGVKLSFEEYIELERNGIIECSQSYDMAEAINAFIEKRKAKFKS